MIAAIATAVVKIIAAAQPKTDVAVPAVELEVIEETENMSRAGYDKDAATETPDESTTSSLERDGRTPSVLSIPIITLKVRTAERSLVTYASTDSDGRYTVRKI